MVSPDEMNAHLATVTVVPMTTGSRPAPFRMAVRFKGKERLLLADRLRTVDGRRLIKRLIKRLGSVEAGTLAAMLAVLGEMFAL